MEKITFEERQNTPDEERLVQMLKALGNPVRFRIMQTLAERETCITQEIVETTPLAQSTVSQHLKVLREAGLVEGEFEGPATCYCLSETGVRWLKEQIEGWLPDCCEPSGRVAPVHLKLEGPEAAGCCN
jgi:ArsR family transcriptional regulator, arsenate/arsenite/antimonite-responsive transcriptional repressor